MHRRSKCKLSSITAQFIQANKCTFPVGIGLRLWHYTLSRPSETWLQTWASWRGSSWRPHRAQMSISINHTPAWRRHKKGPEWPCLIWSNSKLVSVMTAPWLKRKNMVFPNTVFAGGSDSGLINFFPLRSFDSNSGDNLRDYHETRMTRRPGAECGYICTDPGLESNTGNW